MMIKRAWNTAKNLFHEKIIFTLVTYFIYSFQFYICFLISQIREKHTSRGAGFSWETPIRLMRPKNSISYIPDSCETIVEKVSSSSMLPYFFSDGYLLPWMLIMEIPICYMALQQTPAREIHWLSHLYTQAMQFLISSGLLESSQNKTNRGETYLCNCKEKQLQTDSIRVVKNCY